MNDDGFCTSRAEFESCIEEAAERGAKKALKEVGLLDEDAGEDIRDLRTLMAAFRSAKSTAWQTVVKILTTFIISALSIGAAFKFGIIK